MEQYIIPAAAAIVVAVIEAVAATDRKRQKKREEKRDEREASREQLMVLLVHRRVYGAGRGHGPGRTAHTGRALQRRHARCAELRAGGQAQAKGFPGTAGNPRDDLKGEKAHEKLEGMVEGGGRSRH